ncbi:peptidoglycan-binding protein [Treponema sp. R80B11-R83G3]
MGYRKVDDTKGERGMNCLKIMDLYHEAQEGGEDSISLLSQIQVWAHSLFCPVCAEKIERYEAAKILMKEDFFPSSPALEETIMARIDAEQADEARDTVGGFSTQSWVIAGLVILISLATVFFGFDFQRLALESGMSFMLPVGITIGIVLTTYGALFIGSHLKELSERFGL